MAVAIYKAAAICHFGASSQKDMRIMRAEAEALALDIKQSMGLLRRHL